ncbi:hypothetical protein [Bosea sp. NBC_00550]|uniref:hypothetical protein n=1 Tax=Bosea sp. NBC_00550 TaxID=2969621 RepID=UPI00222E6FEA|nr:hypothetical protein [Bosea sp. NBC_00550]UZF94177.1 hypothetical protein NWE53_08310 [Bosea sp. NBC_00550]
MPRLAITLSCSFFVAATLSTSVFAAGRSFGPAAPVGIGHGRPGLAHPHPGVRPWRGADRRAYGRHHRQLGWGGFDYPWAWPGFDTASGGVTVIERQAEAPKPIDPYAFENLMPRAGIRPSPTPEPTIYRLEGPRSRPTARVIRIAGADDARDGARSRFAHAETGALLLTVPRR